MPFIIQPAQIIYVRRPSLFGFGVRLLWVGICFVLFCFLYVFAFAFLDAAITDLAHPRPAAAVHKIKSKTRRVEAPVFTDAERDAQEEVRLNEYMKQLEDSRKESTKQLEDYRKRINRAVGMPDILPEPPLVQ